MALLVELTDLARQDIEAIANYLSLNWSEKVKMDFLVELTENIKRIAEMPYLFRTSAKLPNVRECVMNKHTIVYYRITVASIEILTIRSTHQNPDIIL